MFKTATEAPSTKSGEVSVPPQRSPSATQPQPTLAELLLPQLRHNSTGFEALSVVVQYLVYDVSIELLSLPSNTPTIKLNKQLRPNLVYYDNLINAEIISALSIHFTILKI